MTVREASDLTGNMASWSRPVREAAEQQLTADAEEAVPALADLVERERIRVRRYRMASRGFCMAGTACWLFSTVYDALQRMVRDLRGFLDSYEPRLHAHTSIVQIPLVIAVLSITTGLVVVPLIRWATQSRRLLGLVRALECTGGAAAVKPLASLLTFAGRRARREALSALRSLLPLLQNSSDPKAAAHSDLPELLRLTCDRASATYDPDLAVLVLAALGALGNDSAMAQLRLLATRTGRGAKEDRIREAAWRCLIALNALRAAGMAPPRPSGAADLAQAVYERAGAESSGRLSDLAGRMDRAWKRQSRLEWAVTGALFVGLISWLAWSIARLAGHPSMGSLGMVVGALSASLYVGVLAGVAKMRHFKCVVMPRDVRGAIQEMRDTDDLNAIRPLLNVVLGSFARRDTSLPARQTLLRLLPKVTENDGHLLGAAERRAINDRLANYATVRRNAMASGMLALQGGMWRQLEQLYAALLDMLAKIGQADSIAAVTAVCDIPESAVTTPEARSVRDAAQVCLASLLERQGSDAQRLLRPAQIDPGSTLLRPAGGDAPASDEQLLRPASFSGSVTSDKA